MSEVYCVNCKHYAVVPQLGDERGMCQRPREPVEIRSKVTGELQTFNLKPQSCFTERMSPACCGPNGRFFEPHLP